MGASGKQPRTDDGWSPLQGHTWHGSVVDPASPGHDTHEPLPWPATCRTVCGCAPGDLSGADVLHVVRAWGLERTACERLVWSDGEALERMVHGELNVKLSE